MTTAVAPPQEVGAPPPTSFARLAAVAALAIAVFGALLVPGGTLDSLVGDTGLTVVSGTVEVGGGDQWRVAPVGRRLPANSQVRAPDGTATLALADGELVLAEGTRLQLGGRIEVLAGSVLADVDDLTLAAGPVAATGRGPWRIDGAGPARVGAYEGDVVVTDAAGRESLVRSLQELRIRDGVADGVPRPYVYRAGDPFDEQRLGSAFAVDEFVAALERGLVADYGTAPQSRTFYLDFDGLDGQLVAALADVGIVSSDARVGPPANVLVAAVMTDAVAERSGRTPADAAAVVRDRRLAGATWGLIAYADGVRPADVRAAADRALIRRQEQVEQGVAAPIAAPGTPTDGGGAPDGTPDGDQPNPGPEPDPSDPSSPPDEPDEPDDSDASGPVGSTVDEVDEATGVGELLGDEGGETLDESAEVVDDLIDGVLGTSSGDGDGSDADSSVLEETADTLGEAVEDTADVVDGLGATVGGLLGAG